MDLRVGSLDFINKLLPTLTKKEKRGFKSTKSEMKENCNSYRNIQDHKRLL